MQKNIYRKKFGCYGEKIAGWYYQKNGYTIIARNVYTRYGEIDLLLSKGEKITVAEVKTRVNNKYGWPEETVSTAKIKHLINAYYTIQKRENLPDQFDLEACIIEIDKGRAKIRRYLIDILTNI